MKQLELGLSGLILLTFVAAAGFFAAGQALWVDETTQLSGITLSLGEQLGWLTGRLDPGLAVPPDRMPPFSYWLGEAWSALFGLTETPMRWLGIAVVLCAAPAIHGLGRMAGGAWGGVFALAFVYLMPFLVVQAVEIRTYPLFFALSAWAVWAFARVILSPEGGETVPIWPAAVLAIAAAYAHFFGLLMALCLFVALLVDRLMRGLPLGRLFAAAAIAGVLALGLVPFALSAVGVSGGLDEMVAIPPSLTELVSGAVTLVLRLGTHGSHLAYPVALILTLGGIAGLALLSFTRLARPLPEGAAPRRAPLLVALPIVLALVLLMVVDRALDGFPAFGPHYNLWMVPLAALFLSFGFGFDGRMRWLAPGLGLAAVAGHLVAGSALLGNRDIYSHGPGEWLAAQVTDPASTLVVHDGTGTWGHAYFPLVYLTEGAVTQIRVAPEGVFRIIPGGEEPVTDPAGFAAQFDTVLLVSTRTLPSAQLGALSRGEADCTPLPLPAPLLVWALPEAEPPQSYCALFAASTQLSRSGG